MGDQDARYALRTHLVETLYKALSPNFEISFADGYGPAADALLALGEIEERWETYADDEEWAGGGWYCHHASREEAEEHARKKPGAKVRCRFSIAVDMPFEVPRG